MKAVNGTLLIALSVFVLWIGVTGRFPKLMEAIGIVRGKPTTNPALAATPKPSNGSGSESTNTEKSYEAASGGGVTKNIIMGNPLVWPGWLGYKAFQEVTK